MKICAVLFAICLLALLVVTAQEIFDPGGHYPIVDFSPGPHGVTTSRGTYGEYLKEVGLAALAFGLLGSVLFFFVGFDDDDS